MSGKGANPQVSTTVARAMRLMDLLADRPEGVTLAELTRALDTQRAPLYRILAALMQSSLVHRDQHLRYRLGVGVIRLARAYASQFPAGMEQVLSELANEVGVTVTLVSAEEDVLTTIVSVTPSTSSEHVFTPPGFQHPDGPLASRIALHAAQPPSEDDTEQIVEARRRGFAIARAALREPVRYAAAAAVPGSVSGNSGLIVALVSLQDFDAENVGPQLLRAAELLSGPFQSRHGAFVGSRPSL